MFFYFFTRLFKVKVQENRYERIGLQIAICNSHKRLYPAGPVEQTMKIHFHNYAQTVAWIYGAPLLKPEIRHLKPET